jgi:hypothetical protein
MKTTTPTVRRALCGVFATCLSGDHDAAVAADGAGCPERNCSSVAAEHDGADGHPADAGTGGHGTPVAGRLGRHAAGGVVRAVTSEAA